MSERMVWAATSGSYSDYRILCLFDTKKRAEAFLKAPRSPDNWDRPDDVQAMVLFEGDSAPAEVTIYGRQADVGDDGTVSREWTHDRVMWDYEFEAREVAKRPKVRFVRAPCHKDKGGRLEVTGPNLKAVEKSYSDNLAQMKMEASTNGRIRAR